VTADELRDAIEIEINRLLDLDIIVDDARRELDAAVERVRHAVRHRDRAALHLQQLRDLAAAQQHRRGTHSVRISAPRGANA